MSNVPTALYKYLSADRAATVLENLQIRFSQASVLNDASELNPLFKGIAPAGDVRTILLNRLKQKYGNVIDGVQRLLPKGEAERLIEDVIAKHAVYAETYLPESTKKIRDILDINFGILSLSETPSDTRLWGYYADGGRGFLIEFDPAHEWFWAQKTPNDDFRHLRPVIYVSERPEKYLVQTSGDEILYTKGSQWAHEKEWRIIRCFNDAALKAGYDQYGKDVLLFDIPPCSIQNIVIGFRSTSDAVKKMEAVIGNNPALAHVRFRQAAFDRDVINVGPRT